MFAAQVTKVTPVLDDDGRTIAVVSHDETFVSDRKLSRQEVEKLGYTLCEKSGGPYPLLCQTWVELDPREPLAPWYKCVAGHLCPDTPDSDNTVQVP